MIKNSLKTIFSAIILTSTIFSASVYAEDYGSKTIKRIGCHRNNTTCFAYVDSQIGPSTCANNVLRWQMDEQNGAQIFTGLMAAYLSGKKVTLGGVACRQQDNVPTIAWYELE